MGNKYNMIQILHEMECELGRLPYTYEVMERTGLRSASATKLLKATEIFPETHEINDTEKLVVDAYKITTSQTEIAKMLGIRASVVGNCLIKLRDKGIIDNYARIAAKPKKREKKEKFVLDDEWLKPLPKKRVWSPYPAGGTLNGL